MRYYVVDVFAEQKYQGNPLAVFLPDQECSKIEMQQIAREINYSETTFIMSGKKQDGGYDVRIFTPDREVPFAGHPTLGTAFIINQLLEQSQCDQVILNLGVGQIPVNITEEELSMEQKGPDFRTVIEQPEVMAEILQINVEDINCNYPIQVVSTGLPSIIVPLHTLDAVKRCSIHHEKFQAFIDHTVKAGVLVFAPESEKEENDLRVRVFMDDTGFLEDPATGSANGNLAGYLLEHNFYNTPKINLRVEQGYEMGRPSLIKVEAEKVGRQFRINIGGKVFLVAKGEWMN
ncbi:PhzF family phenazine biosynthesis protein [Paenibacillus sediminis]|uniref:Trans-2,3-dihydro-3-hydroxyanthranilate isomerase n=1 Tax=Paenibacillus sediminis TaxID=664909 RepID=A0ABS4H3T2_9BACL|nr:PhzF family phenazine biosynthesis protein [Paenibacillus sediminis]MBP1937190.1 trans-2,3-dihydro-3-hydroxyanthranilate isomerase [Paenibacillus sediminis]